MSSFARRVLGAALLDRRVYEEVEADHRATGDAVAIVVLAGVAGGIGMPGLGPPSVLTLASGTIGALAGWMAWAMVTYVIGTQLLAEPQTRASIEELLRTTAFASAPGLLRIFGVIPVVGLSIYVLASIWMLLAMIVAVRQALDYTSTGRAVGVCVVGGALALAVVAILGLLFAPTVLSLSR